MRDAEIKSVAWVQIDFDKRILTVGQSKTDAGTGRTIPLNGTVLDALVDHTRWYVARFGETQPDWFLFPGGGRSPKDPTTPITSMKTAWNAIRKKAGVSGRWHDNRHTLITELAESPAPGTRRSWRSLVTFRARCFRAIAISGRRPSGTRWKPSSRNAQPIRSAGRNPIRSRGPKPRPHRLVYNSGVRRHSGVR